jgi:CxxC motif-containing protein (DUF1111 family)
MTSTPLLIAFAAFAASLPLNDRRAADPGPRPGPPAAGGPLAGLTPDELTYFLGGQQLFMKVDSVQGTIPGTDRGLGPGFNMDSCAGCHAHPAVGGSSPALNPQVAAATAQGATNVTPFFVQPDGPVREARFKYRADGSRDGAVHPLFTIAGRSDAPGCALAQPDFRAAAAANNLVFRIPTPAFGAGLIEAIPDEEIRRNQAAGAAARRALGIAGHPNTNGNDGTITRFGWKAQNKSLMLFAAEAYNVEQGVTNEIFPNERSAEAGCIFNGVPESTTNFEATRPADAPGDIAQFAIFMRFLAPPAPAPETPSITRGRAVFSNAGCALCHTPTLTTGPSSSVALSRRPVNLYSDLLVHRMGAPLADDIVQGAAGPDEFRTAPLWGLGQRLFFLHDGRTADLLEAIRAHGGEAERTVERFRELPETSKQDLLNFLRSL